MLLLYVTTHGQDKAATYSAFTIDNKEVIWVQVYHAQQRSDVLRERVLEFLKDR